jgi:hypothetical protein
MRIIFSADSLRVSRDSRESCQDELTTLRDVVSLAQTSRPTAKLGFPISLLYRVRLSLAAWLPVRSEVGFFPLFPDGGILDSHGSRHGLLSTWRMYGVVAEERAG